VGLEFALPQVFEPAPVAHDAPTRYTGVTRVA